MWSIFRENVQNNVNSKISWKKHDCKFEEPKIMDILEKLKEINTNQMSPNDNPE